MINWLKSVWQIERNAIKKSIIFMEIYNLAARRIC